MKDKVEMILVIIIGISGVIFTISIMFYDTKIGLIACAVSLIVFIISIMAALGIAVYEPRKK